jgi:hypothetical protein
MKRTRDARMEGSEREEEFGREERENKSRFKHLSFSSIELLDLPNDILYVIIICR